MEQGIYEVIDGLDDTRSHRPLTVGEVKEERQKKQRTLGIANGLFAGVLIVYVVLSGMVMMYAYSFDPLLAMLSFSNLIGVFLILFMLLMVQKNILLFIMRK